MNLRVIATLESELFWVSGRIIICLWWKWQLLMAAQQRWARLASSPLPLWHTHTFSNRRVHVHLHTPTLMQWSAVSATRRMLSSLTHTHTQARPGFPPWNYQQEMKPYRTTLHYLHTAHVIQYKKNLTDCTVSSFGQTHPDVTAAWLTHLTPYNSIQFHHLVLFWHQSAGHHWCTYVHLSVTQCYKRKLIWVSQSAAECFIRHTLVCVHSVLSPLFSLALSLRPAQRTLRLFRFTLTIDHVGESCNHDSNK